MDAVASVRDTRTVRFGDGPTTPSFGVGGESPLISFMTLGQRSHVAIFDMAHEDHADVELTPYWLGDLEVIYEVNCYCPECRVSVHLDLQGEEVKHAEVL